MRTPINLMAPNYGPGGQSTVANVTEAQGAAPELSVGVTFRTRVTGYPRKNVELVSIDNVALSDRQKPTHARTFCTSRSNARWARCAA